MAAARIGLGRRPNKRFPSCVDAPISSASEQHYADGTFLASGRKVPRDGGIILAVAPDRPTIEAIAATDPFVPAAVVTYRITEFLATTVAPALAPHRETLPA